MSNQVLQVSGVGAPGQMDSKSPKVARVGSGLRLTRDNQEARVAEAECGKKRERPDHAAARMLPFTLSKTGFHRGPQDLV